MSNPKTPEDALETIEISVKDFDKLCADSDFLACLRGCGVDNWDGYEDACEMYSQMDDE